MSLVLRITFVLLALATAGCSTAPERDIAKETWLGQARFGVFLHYLLGGNYNKATNSFDVERFADQIASTKADYVIFTLGQNSGYYCSPNATYERYAGYAPGERCTQRDLPMEIAGALAKRHIRLMLYLPSRSPQRDLQAMKGLADTNEREIAPQDFIKRWSEVIEEWSLRYGRKVSGWWFDGAYRPDSWQDMSKPYNFKTWAAAARAGNPDSVLAFNEGDFTILTQEQDYTAGEAKRFGATPDLYPPHPNTTWHVLSYLGDHWGHPSGPNYTDKWLIDYVRRVNRQGGVVSIDVHIAPNGTIYPPHLQQLIHLGAALK